jgi:signal peptidase I
VIFLSGVGLLAYRVLFLKLIRVPTGSMMNTILPGDQLTVNRLLREPRRGDVVVYSYPGEEVQFVGRIIGLPGESIQLRATAILINDKQIDEERAFVGVQGPDTQQLSELSREGQGPYRVYYAPPDDHSAEPLEFAEQTFGIKEPFRIPKDSYFILGDNRDNSLDGRYRGPVPQELIWGTVSVVYWSEPVHGGDVRWERVGKSVKQKTLQHVRADNKGNL